jgi:hypothetical protein
LLRRPSRRARAARSARGAIMIDLILEAGLMWTSGKV